MGFIAGTSPDDLFITTQSTTVKRLSRKDKEDQDPLPMPAVGYRRERKQRVCRLFASRGTDTLQDTF